MRSFAVAFLVAVGVLTAHATPSLAAFQTVELSAPDGPVGTRIGIHVEISGLLGSSPSAMWLVGKEAFESSPARSDCEDIAGASAVGELTWEAATVEFQGGEYPGFVTDAVFSVPEVAPGTYFLAQTISAAGTSCHTFTPFEVTAGAVPDTAIRSDGSDPALGQVALAAGLIVTVSIAIRSARYRSRS